MRPHDDSHEDKIDFFLNELIKITSSKNGSGETLTMSGNANEIPAVSEKYYFNRVSHDLRSYFECTNQK